MNESAIYMLIGQFYQVWAMTEFIAFVYHCCI